MSNKARTCKQCGSSYEHVKGSGSGYKFCSRQCAVDSKGLSGKTREQINAELRAAYDKRNTFTCKNCGESFIRNRKRSGNDGKTFCSRECAFEFNKAKPKTPQFKPVAHRPCIVCGEYFDSTHNKITCSNTCLHEYRHAEYRLAIIDEKSARPPVKCGECGTEFRPGFGDKRTKYCSSKCNRRAYRREYRRLHGHSDSHRARARRAGVEYEPISIMKVFDRDGWTCQICGISTPRKLRGSTKPNAPELDHVMPFALGGPHTYSNVQCACRSCNAEKGGTAVIGQVGLFSHEDLPNASL